jgi:hypothetical protein
MGWPDYQRQIWFRIVLKERTDLPLLPLEMIGKKCYSDLKK